MEARLPRRADRLIRRAGLVVCLALIGYLVGMKMNAPVEPDLVVRDLPAERFWGLYFDDKFVALERGEHEYRGVFQDYSRARKDLGVQFPRYTGATLKRSTLAAYAYSQDPRFNFAVKDFRAIVAAALDSEPHAAGTAENEALLEVLETMSARGTRQAPKLAYSERRQRARRELPDGETLYARTIEYLRKSLVSKEARKRFEVDGLTTHLRTEKRFFIRALGNANRPAAGVELRAIAANPAEDHAVALVALHALSRLNRKEDIPFLLDLLGNPELTPRRAAAHRALQFLASGKELAFLPIGQEFQQFWSATIPSLPTDAQRWLEWDAASLFWEKRLLVALACQTNRACSTSLSQKLADDEVLVVRQAALPAAEE